MYRVFKIALVLSIGLTLFSCVSESDLDPVTDEPDATIQDGPLAGLNVSASFDYTTSDEVNVTLDVPQFLSSAVFTLYSKTGTLDSIPFGRATFDNEGHFEQDFVLTAQADSIILVSDYLGLTKDIHLPIQNNSVSFDYRPLYDRSGTVNKVAHTTFSTSKGRRNLTSRAPTYNYLSTYNGLGVPDFAESHQVIPYHLE
ncbi:MAG: hypothetical protein AAFY00_13755, partial [Bacteroidota bacterium]